MDLAEESECNSEESWRRGTDKENQYCGLEHLFMAAKGSSASTTSRGRRRSKHQYSPYLNSRSEIATALPLRQLTQAFNTLNFSCDDGLDVYVPLLSPHRLGRELDALRESPAPVNLRLQSAHSEHPAARGRGIRPRADGLFQGQLASALRKTPLDASPEPKSDPA